MCMGHTVEDRAGTLSRAGAQAAPDPAGDDLRRRVHSVNLNRGIAYVTRPDDSIAR
ncbi:hypothetical protein GCM10017788_08650 [Amycolatopsis acidiphila]|nr:hypothetical protein GCM10017788_08650 [Amycolatopsis acidiphila]